MLPSLKLKTDSLATLQQLGRLRTGENGIDQRLAATIFGSPAVLLVQANCC